MSGSAPIVKPTKGESLGVQERTIAGYAMMHGMTVDRTVIERGVSGAKPIGQ
jgi:hypothetical protein